jgi:hypothetical protein
MTYADGRVIESSSTAMPAAGGAPAAPAAPAGVSIPIYICRYYENFFTLI